MKILVITQIMDVDDPVLGFFHRWIEVFANRFQEITVICLKKGRCVLPNNVRVVSLGKEEGVGRSEYVRRFYKTIWNERKNYDAVFVHMNQEYILLAGLLWKVMSKPIFMWRNHHSGSLLTRCAVGLCQKVFCTSRYSYTAQFKRHVRMPVGIDSERFSVSENNVRKPHSVLFLARIAPVKKPDMLLTVFHEASKSCPSATLTFVGDSLPQHEYFFTKLKDTASQLSCAQSVIFQKAVTNSEAIGVYNSHDIFVNLSTSGMYDKTIFEAMACGCLVLVSNESLRGEIDDMFIFSQGDQRECAAKLQRLLSLSLDERTQYTQKLREYVATHHSLVLLTDMLYTSITK